MAKVLTGPWPMSPLPPKLGGPDIGEVQAIWAACGANEASFITAINERYGDGTKVTFEYYPGKVLITVIAKRVATCASAATESA